MDSKVLKRSNSVTRIIQAWLLHFIFFLAGTGSSYSQDSEIYKIQRLTGPVILDGKVDEPAWAKIDPLPLVTHWPVFGKSVESGTEIRIAYDDENLYVSGILPADPEKITAPTFKRDAIGMNLDGLSIILDTFRDNENALWFLVTPTGSRTDIALSNDAQGDGAMNPFWDTIWEAETEITDSGWTVEIKIPFTSLRYETSSGIVEMGLIAYRYSAHDVSMEIFPAIPPKWGFWSFAKPSQASPVYFENIPDRNPVYVTPYVLGGQERTFSQSIPEGEFLPARDNALEAGFDLKMGLSNNTTLDLTINTDFAQVEADDQEINLTRFSLFFPERRQFFLERASIFDFTFGDLDRLFHSRRIGLSEGQPLRILGGSRMITRTGGWDIGLLSMQTSRAVLQPSEILQPSENFSVVRFRRQMFNPQSYAGGMITSRIDVNGNYNIAYGMDGIFRLWGEDFLNFNVAQALDSDITSPLLSENSLRLRTGLERRTFSGFSYNLSYNYSGNDYEPGMGFQLRSNYMRFGDRLSYGWQPGEGSPFQRIRLSLNSAVYLDNETGSIETSETGPSLLLDWKRGNVAQVQWMIVTEDIPLPFNLSPEVEIPEGSYRYPVASLQYETHRGKPLRAILSAEGGGFFDGTRLSIGIQPRWDISRVISLDMFYQYNRVNFRERAQELIAHLARARAEFTFNTKLTFSSFIQYNSTINLGVINARFRYNPRDGNNFYLVFNETLNSNRAATLPRMPFSMNRTVLMKYTYTFLF